MSEEVFNIFPPASWTRNFQEENTRMQASEDSLSLFVSFQWRKFIVRLPILANDHKDILFLNGANVLGLYVPVKK